MAVAEREMGSGSGDLYWMEIIRRRKRQVKLLRRQVLCLKAACGMKVERVKALRMHLSTRDFEVETLRGTVAAQSERLESVEHQLSEEGAQFDAFRQEQSAMREESAECFEGRVCEIGREKEEALCRMRAEWEESASECESRFRERRRALKDDIVSLSGQVEASRERAESVTREYDRTFCSLRAKCDSLGASVTEARAQWGRSERALNEVKAECVAAKVATRILDTQLRTDRERFERQLSVAAAANRLGKIELESEFERRVEDTTAGLEKGFSQFLFAVCEKFGDFCDFGSPISRVSVASMLDRAVERHEAASGELRQIRDALGVGPNDRVAPCVRDVLSRLESVRAETAHECERKAAVAAGGASGASGAGACAAGSAWEVWGSRLASLITGRVCVGKSEGAMRGVIEEAILDALGNRQLWHKVETLRSEKRLMEQGASRVSRMPFAVPRFRTLTCATLAVLRMLRVSGHMRCPLFSRRRDEHEGPRSFLVGPPGEAPLYYPAGP